MYASAVACLIHDVLVMEDARLNTQAIPFLACTEKQRYFAQGTEFAALVEPPKVSAASNLKFIKVSLD